MLSVLAFVPMLYALAPRIEAILSPVVTGRVDTYTRNGLELQIEILGDKRRPGCRIEAARVDFKPDYGPAVAVDRGGPRNRIARGRFKIDAIYFLSPRASFPGVLRRITWYRCHPLWLTPYEPPLLRIE